MIALAIGIIFFNLTCNQKVQRKFRAKQSKRSLLLMICGSFLGKSIRRVIPPANSFRCSLASWFLFSFLIIITFKSQLKSTLVLPRPLKDIDTIDELVDSGLNIILKAQFAAEFEKYLGAESIARIKDRMVLIPTVDFDRQFWDNRTWVNRTYGHVVSNRQMPYALTKSFDPITKAPFYHVMRESILPFASVYLTEMGSPFLPRINELVGLFHQSGMTGQWMKEASFQDALDNRLNWSSGVDEREMQDSDSINQIVITMEHLQIAFYILAMGAVLSAVVFFVELAWDGYNRRKNVLKTISNNKFLF